MSSDVPVVVEMSTDVSGVAGPTAAATMGDADFLAIQVWTLTPHPAPQPLLLTQPHTLTLAVQAGAERAYRRCLHIQELNNGSDHAILALTLVNLGALAF